jgi:cytochrome bd-type quinol oxidase subunit 2
LEEEIYDLLHKKGERERRDGMDKPKKSGLVLLLILLVLTVWPILTIFNRIEPRILGWPLSIVWPLFIFAILTIVLLWLNKTAEGGE